jgi:hypothetical protein
MASELVEASDVYAQVIQLSLFDDSPVVDTAATAETDPAPVVPSRWLDARSDHDLDRQILTAGAARSRSSRSSRHTYLCLIQAIADEMAIEGWQEKPAGERLAESTARYHRVLRGERACPIATTCAELARAREMDYIPPWEPGYPGWDSRAVAAECKRRREEKRERRRRAYEERTARRRKGNGRSAQ